jgi:hypothetical protein
MSEAHRVALEVFITRETEAAIEVCRADGFGRRAWLPKSLIAVESERSDGVVIVLVAPALARARGVLA